MYGWRLSPRAVEILIYNIVQLLEMWWFPPRSSPAVSFTCRAYGQACESSFPTVGERISPCFLLVLQTVVGVLDLTQDRAASKSDFIKLSDAHMMLLRSCFGGTSKGIIISNVGSITAL